MRTALILHGKPDAEEYYEMDFPSPSNAHWIPWLQQKFLRANILCQAPEMPTPYAPRYEPWKVVFQNFVQSGDSILVGHSCGGGFLLKWLSENKDFTASKLVLVAPWLDPQREAEDFLTCKIDPALEKRMGEIHVLYSDDEPVEGVKEACDLVQATYSSAKLHKFTDKGHFCFDNVGFAFPELWNICKP